MGLLEKFFGEKNKINGIQGTNCLNQLKQFLKEKYIIIDAVRVEKFKSSQIIALDMIKVFNNEIIADRKLFLDVEKNYTLLRNSKIKLISEDQFYENFISFCDYNLENLNLVVETEDVYKTLKERLEKNGYTGKINYINLVEVLKPTYKEMETNKRDEYYMRLGVYYNIFSSETEYNKKNLELQFLLLNMVMSEKDKSISYNKENEKIKYVLKPKDTRVSLKNRKEYNKEQKVLLPNGSWCTINIYYWYSSYIEGRKYWLNGEKFRKNNELELAIEEYDKARYYCYEQRELYISYSDVYRQLKKYDDEVVILDEGIKIVKGNIDILYERRNEAFGLAVKANEEREKKKEQKAKELEEKKRLEEEKRKEEERLEEERKKEEERLEEERKKEKERLKEERKKEEKRLKEERKKEKERLEKERKAKEKERLENEKKIYEEKRNKFVLQIIESPNLCLLYREIIKNNVNINKKIEKLELKKCKTFEELLWYYIFLIYDNQKLPDKIDKFYCENCYINTNIMKNAYIKEYILNYFTKNKQDRMYYELFEKKERENEKNYNKYWEKKTSIFKYVEFFARVILCGLELVSIENKFESNEELEKMYENLIMVTDDVKYITEKVYPIYKKCYISEMKMNVSKIDMEIVIYLKRKLIDVNEIEITQKNKKQALINIMIENYGKILKKEENKFIYYLIKLIAIQKDDINNYISSLKRIDKIIESINDEIALEEAEKEKERILGGDLSKEITLNRLKMTYASVTSPAEFEKYIADLYERLGYTIDEVVDKNKRGGADIIAFKDNIKYVIQVKYYTKPVNKNGIIEVVAAKKLYKANKGIHVTNNSYSMSAMQFAAQNNIELIDGEIIEEYINEVSQKNN